MTKKKKQTISRWFASHKILKSLLFLSLNVNLWNHPNETAIPTGTARAEDHAKAVPPEINNF